MSSLKVISIPSSVETIGDWSFQGCCSLGQINFEKPYSLKKIGEFAFYSCTSLTKVSIPSSVVSIEKCAFEGCFGLKEVVFEKPSSLKSIGIYAFKNCLSLRLETIDITPSVKIGQHAFDGLYKERYETFFSPFIEDDHHKKPKDEKKCNIYWFLF